MSSSIGPGGMKQGGADRVGTRKGLGGERILRLPELAMASAVVLAVFTVIFGIWTASSVWSFPRFVMAVIMLAYLPGKLVFEIARLRLGPLESLTLSLLVGMILSGILYWITSFLKIPIFLVWPFSTAIILLYRHRKNWQQFRNVQIRLRMAHLMLVGVIILGIIPFALLPLWYRNLTLLPYGGISYPTNPDVILHLSIANELTHTIPPQIPFLAGAGLTYHYGMDLLTALFSYSAGLNILDLTLRFMPTLFVGLAVLAIFCFSRTWLHSEYAAAFTAFLVMFGEDFSFIPGLLLGSKGVWSNQFFHVPSTYSLFSLNPMLPALSILFGGLFCLLKFCEEESNIYGAILAAFLFAILAEFKIFAAVQLLGALTVAGAVYVVRFRDTRLQKVLVLTVILMAPLLLYTWFGNVAGAMQSVRLEPSPYIPQAMTAMGFPNTALGERVNALFNTGTISVTGIAALLLLALPLYLLGSLGLRVVAIPALLKEIVSPHVWTAQRFFIAVFVISGLVITMVTRITPNGQQGYNNALWFYVQSKYVAWIFVVELIWVLFRGRTRVVQLLVLILVVGLSIPSTVQYFGTQMSPKPAILLNRYETELLDYLRRVCLQGEIVFIREELAKATVATTKCRVPYANVFAGSFVAQDELAQRQRDQRNFWDAESTEEVRREILQRYKSDYLVIAKGTDPDPGRQDYLMDGPLFENDGFIVYRVRRNGRFRAD
jgi:hypothetical protein